MSNYVMNVDFFGNGVRAETNGHMVSLNDLMAAGNIYRLSKGKAAYQMNAFLGSISLQDYIEAASEIWGIPKEKFIVKTGRGKTTRTMVHVSIALLAAEQISPWFHASAHKIFIEGKLLEFREQGGTEFKTLNIALDTHLPNEYKNDRKTVYIKVAAAIRSKIMGKNAVAGCWNEAAPDQLFKRFDVEKQLVNMLKVGVIRDLEHLLDVINRV